MVLGMMTVAMVRMEVVIREMSADQQQLHAELMGVRSALPQSSWSTAEKVLAEQPHGSAAPLASDPAQHPVMEFIQTPSDSTLQEQTAGLSASDLGPAQHMSDGANSEFLSKARRLENQGYVALYTSATLEGGCVRYASTSNINIDLATKACNSVRCPPCWVFHGSTNAITFQNCATGYVSNTIQLGASDTAGDIGFVEYTFVNAGSGNAVISSVASGTNAITLATMTVKKAICWSNGMRSAIGGVGTLGYLVPLAA